MPSFVTRLARSEAASLAPSLTTDRPLDPASKSGRSRLEDEDGPSQR
jgi:hypothetical protein